MVTVSGCSSMASITNLLTCIVGSQGNFTSAGVRHHRLTGCHVSSVCTSSISGSFRLQASHLGLGQLAQGAFSPPVTEGRQRLQVRVQAAKKGAKPKGPGSKKASKTEEEEAPPPAPVALPYTQGETIIHSLALIDSHYRALEKPIFLDKFDVATAVKALYEAPFALLSWGIEDEPLFNYGNESSLKLFDLDWSTLVSTPSSQLFSGALENVSTQMVDAALEKPVDLAGVVRVSSAGRKFEIKEGTLWTLVDLEGDRFGQAAVLREWESLDKADGDAGADDAKEGAVGAEVSTEALTAVVNSEAS